MVPGVARNDRIAGEVQSGISAHTHSAAVRGDIPGDRGAAEVGDARRRVDRSAVLGCVRAVDRAGEGQRTAELADRAAVAGRGLVAREHGACDPGSALRHETAAIAARHIAGDSAAGHVEGCVRPQVEAAAVAIRGVAFNRAAADDDRGCGIDRAAFVPRAVSGKRRACVDDDAVSARTGKDRAAVIVGRTVGDHAAYADGFEGFFRIDAAALRRRAVVDLAVHGQLRVLTDPDRAAVVVTGCAVAKRGLRVYRQADAALYDTAVGSGRIVAPAAAVQSDLIDRQRAVVDDHAVPGITPEDKSGVAVAVVMALVVGIVVIVELSRGEDDGLALVQRGRLVHGVFGHHHLNTQGAGGRTAVGCTQTAAVDLGEGVLQPEVDRGDRVIAVLVIKELPVLVGDLADDIEPVVGELCGRAVVLSAVGIRRLHFSDRSRLDQADTGRRAVLADADPVERLILRIELLLHDVAEFDGQLPDRDALSALQSDARHALFKGQASVDLASVRIHAGIGLADPVVQREGEVEELIRVGLFFAPDVFGHREIGKYTLIGEGQLCQRDAQDAGNLPGSHGRLIRARALDNRRVEFRRLLIAEKLGHGVVRAADGGGKHNRPYLIVLETEG